TKPVVGRRQAEQLLELLVPGGGHVGGLQLAVDQRLLQLESEDDVNVVSRLVRLDANEGRLHVVDGEYPIVERNVAETAVKRLPGSREEMVPKRPATADLVFPHPRLRFVDAERGRRAPRRAVVLTVESLFVHAVARFMKDAEERVVESLRVVARRDPAIAGAHAGAERVRGHVKPAGRKIEANRRRGRLAEDLLSVHGKVAFDDVAAWFLWRG